MILVNKVKVIRIVTRAMYKFLLCWFLANYSYGNISDSYKTYHSENPIQEMTSFIDKQQFREDQLREHCNLQNFKMKEKPTYYDRILDTVRHGLPTTLYKGLLHSLKYPGLVYSRQMNANTTTDFMNLSYNSKNEGTIITYKDISYTLVQSGIKVDGNVYSYSNQQSYPTPRKPTWTIQLGEHILTISDIN